MKAYIKNLSLEKLQQKLIEWNEKKFHAKQILKWLYKKNVSSFFEMTDISSSLRKRLDECYIINSLEAIEVQNSFDGTKKVLCKTVDGLFIEAVVIPTKKRLTFCISSQAGCKFGCFFCASATRGFQRNLSCAEILDQLSILYRESGRPTNVVFMGIGEPLDNYDNVLEAIRMINAPYGFGLGARHITVSTCGIIPGIERLKDENLQIELSVSLHTADDRLRSRWMPINKRYPLPQLMETLRRYQQKTNRQITFEYILVKGMNCSQDDVKKLGRLFSGLDAKLNLIPVNPTVNKNLNAPNKLEILLFKDALLKQGIPVTLRKPRGQDIDAACGQLRMRYEIR
ncbi:MAG: 23S rRNA (adenine(2503)-C(2))-methyltransferase RlmN [Candidatus Omnitrophica bacterium]|nr:23S rRNA (adenine(2503)-C(2))-methyltransferase RlmN [Candidatus Omnitrophota bacterium]